MSFDRHKVELLNQIKLEKSKEKPDRALIKRLAKRLVKLDEEQDDFLGSFSHTKPASVSNPGARNYNYAKWYPN